MNVPDEVERRVAGARLSAHLATTVDDRPHVAPVWYVYDDGVVSFVTSGTKLRNLRANPRVALSIEKADESEAYWAATLLGTATVVEDPERARPVAERIFEKYDSDGDYGPQPLVRVAVRSATLNTF
jgi:PPOX class probable F420-dependent enzyme